MFAEPGRRHRGGSRSLAPALGRSGIANRPNVRLVDPFSESPAAELQIPVESFGVLYRYRSQPGPLKWCIAP